MIFSMKDNTDYTWRKHFCVLPTRVRDKVYLWEWCERRFSYYDLEYQYAPVGTNIKGITTQKVSSEEGIEVPDE